MLPQVLYLHGINEGERPEAWLPRLDAGLHALGEAAVEPEDVVAPRYDDILGGDLSAADSARRVARRAPAARPDARLEHDARRERFVSALSAGGLLDDFVRNPVPMDGALAVPLFDEARRYRDDPAVRAAIRNRVVDAVPASDRPLVVVGHSLGSVVAADVVAHLGRRVALLLTLGSPLGSVEGLGNLSRLGLPFRYDVVDLWVNVFDPRDPVDTGHGISRRFPAAVDVPVAVAGRPLSGDRHAMRSYAEHPAVARAIAFVRNDRALAASERAALQASVRGQETLLLQQVHLQQLELRLRDAADRRRVRRARRFLAERLAAAVAAGPPGSHRLTSEEILDVPAALVVGRWDDAELVPLLVSLAALPAAAPFEWDADDQEVRLRALAATLDAVRTPGGAVPLAVEGAWSADVSNVDLAGAVLAALEAERKRLRGFPTRALLLSAGAVVLAATGVGVVAAAPVGLAGAALLTSTLAAFGPGGMVGGVVSLVSLTGAGGAALSAGATARGPARAGAAFSREANVAAGAGSLAEQAKGLDEGAFGWLLAVARAILAVQERFGFASDRRLLADTVRAALVELEPWVAAHDEIAKGSPTQKRVSGNQKRLRAFLAELDDRLLPAGPEE